MSQLPNAPQTPNEKEIARRLRSLAGKTVTASYTIDPGDNIVRFDTTVGNLVATLPAVALMQNRYATIKKITVDAHTVTITPATGETIDGAASLTLSAQWQSYTVYSDGTTWSIIWVYDTVTPANLTAEAATRSAADTAEASARATGDSNEATARANADSLLQAKSEKGSASGYASLDASTKVPIAQIPTGATGATVPLGNDSRFSDARTPLAHAASHQNSGSDEVATATAGANAIPKAGAVGTLALGWIPVTLTGRTLVQSVSASAVPVANASPTTVLTLPAAQGASYLVAFTLDAGGAGNYAYAWIICGNGGLTFAVMTSGISGAISAITVDNSGNVKITQTSGGSLNVSGGGLRIV